MRKIVEKSLEAALIKASMELGCSVADLEYEVVQNPSGGFLGLGKKEAIIIVDDKKQRWAKTAHSQSLKITENEKYTL
ncbi:Jag N-terminal domain-containing protein [uncultured Helicobacter sp.]|uniref:Jag N-terminal domain-containing protein n=1 Tax=uncultured Helicobacter sp. TaxID=175537 RepID=UPI00272CBE1C|nr:Jag N-terminal domain-containing protein [uncultured Helicobacter sp.]